MLKCEKRPSVLDIIAAVFVVAQIAIFPLIQFTPGGVSAFWSYIAIILVVTMAFLSIGGDHRGDLVRLGLLSTLVADYFLVIDGERLLEGVIAFIFTQAAYFAYLLSVEPRRSVRIANVASRIAVSLVLVLAAFLVLGSGTDALAIASAIYYSWLVMNAVFAFARGRGELTFAIALVLFAMCDLCIGLDVLFDTYLGSDALAPLFSTGLNIFWIFYQPSQVLIALRLYQNRRVRDNTPC
jgi:hypothetical protein